MASNNFSAQQASRKSSETPSFGQVEGRPFHRSPAQRQSEGSSFGVESTANIPKQASIWAPLDNFKTSFSNQLGHRLVQLLEKGHLKIDPNAIIWIDENGLPTTEGFKSRSRKDLEKPSPHFFAGENADAAGFENEIRTGRALWRQHASGKENLHREFKIVSALGRPVLDRITASRVEEAINREKNDFENLELLQKAFTNIDCLLESNLSILCESIYSLTGVDPWDPDRDSALDILDDELGSNVSDVMGLATLLQLGKAPHFRLTKGIERLSRVASVLRAGQMGPLMRDHLETRGYAVGIDLEPPLSRGRKRRLDSE
ncbi:hypothetical protein N5P37_006194 [Trichoderma harzianum]|uniref:Uncharacterized protein n=1 Tax=Trichoderma harzianum CBS 226.95 TaxID=983964 RepID=A0A2T4AA34_TRIHA|nr:hypothetical protein M431DRAFT_495909 [Trichoderma harzianum CBS 226.95]KAK0761246.1 hypothetical protein N5P37_006194 [Trichoderma harzianum]PTB53954.1 hypothetical protein M431DRAFT_495909 [Trichoderma harzianum CBS 226.95]